ncbi:MAG: ABC transporter permease [candidate division WOR-3 bacterium]
MNKILLIFRKEVLNSLRDRRVLISTVVLPLLVLPVATMVPMMLIASKERQARERPSTIALLGLEYAELRGALVQSGRLQLVSLDSARRAIRQGRLDAAIETIRLPSDSASAQVQILFNAMRTESRAAADKVKLVLGDLSRELLARTIDTLSVNLNPIRTISTNVASAQEMAGYFLGMIIGMMAIIGLIQGGMVMAIDSTAGEKERRTLEVLLAAPISRVHVVLGKYLATLVAGMVSVILMTTGYAISLTIGVRSLAGSTGGEMGFGTLTVSPQVLLVILLVMLSVASSIGALEMAISIFARSYREAQTYLSPLTFLAIIPILFMQTIPVSPGPGLFYVPLLNAMVLIRELLMGSIVAEHITNTIASSLVCAVLALRLAFSVFRRESVLLR